ncbi:energy transducer TonB [Flavobacterium noncentrifugens]|uniref:energy transducer TonB n=1 Tax=Flavobacterium noncentrifugens TaxID=1128970 RepID=UPI001476CF78|nr:energy transducer TonB [Flavobacterium noncentrifugens]
MYFSWYENGNKQIEGEYLKSENDDRSTGSLKINQFWNQQNYQMITGGNGYFDLVTEKGCDEGVIADGLKNGMWYGTDNRFKFNYVEKYNNGKLSVGISSDENLVPHIYRQIEIRPEFPGGIDGFYQYVGRNFRVPEIDNLKGKVFIAFYIEPDGSIDDIKIVKSLHKDVDKEAFRVMSECPNWNAGVLRGIKIKVRYTLPINIQADR